MGISFIENSRYNNKGLLIMSAAKKKLKFDQNEVTEEKYDSEVFNLNRFK